MRRGADAKQGDLDNGGGIVIGLNPTVNVGFPERIGCRGSRRGPSALVADDLTLNVGGTAQVDRVACQVSRKRISRWSNGGSRDQG